MSNFPNIYIINRSVHDFSDATRFGDLVYLTEGNFNKFETSRISRAMKPILEVSEPFDYILISGLSVMVGIACSMFAVRHGKLNLLIFDQKTKSYVERNLSLEDLLDSDFKKLLKKVNSEE